LMLALPLAAGYHLPLASHGSAPCYRVRRAGCMAEAEGSEEPIAAEEVPADAKAAAKAEKKELRDAIANLEALLPKKRGEALAAEEAAKDAGENGYMLLAANFERYRQQCATEMKSMKSIGRVNTLRSLVPFIETFESLQLSSNGEADDDVAKIHAYYGGIYKQLEKLLADWQVTTFEAATGDAFDWRKHERAESIVTEEYADGVIIESRGRGWMLGDEVLLPAKAVVSAAPAPAPEATAADAGGDNEAAETGDGEAADAADETA